MWLQEGREEGIQRKSHDVAFAALREGISPELIARLTGLTMAEIEQLREVDRSQGSDG
jgi:hypothetical protein